MKRIAIVGAGISGLAAAYRLRARGFLVTVFESEDRAGGKARGERRGGYLIEHGPNGWLADRTEVTNLAREVGLESRIMRPSEAYQNRFIVLDESGLQAVPKGPPGLLKTKLLSFSGKLRLLREPFAKPPPPNEETIAEFGARRIGAEATSRLLDAVQTGIYAGDMNYLSMSACFPAITEMEKRHGSLFSALRAMSKEPKKDRALLTFPEGVSELTSTLAQKLGGMLKTSRKVLSWRRDGAVLRLTVEHRGEQEEHETDAIVLTTPTRIQSNLLLPHQEPLAQALRSIVYAPVSVVTLGYRREDIAHPLNGFGFLCPAVSQKKLLGVLFSSSTFPGRAPDDKVILRCLIGGARDSSHTTRPDEDIVTEVRSEVESLLQITALPELSVVIRHDEAIPQYGVGHVQKVSAISSMLKGLPGVFVGGSGLHGVALYDCVRDADRLVQEVSAWAS
jgi:oxygen-dependent protoporphyrinogen oxidase